MRVEDFNSIRKLARKLFYQNEKKVYDKILLAKALNLMFLCHMLDPSPDMLQLLLNNYERKIFYSYDIKVFMSCIKIEIFKEKDIMTIV